MAVSRNTPHLARHRRSGALRRGGHGVAYYDTTVGNAGAEFRATDVDVERTADAAGEYNVGWIKAGEWLNDTISIAESGTYVLTVCIAARTAGGTFDVEFDGIDQTGPLVIPDTGSWQTWTDVTTTVTLTGGVRSMRFVADANGPAGAFGNVNYLKVLSTAPYLASAFH